MPKKPPKKPHTQRPKGPGAEPPAAKRVRKQAAVASDVASSEAYRCERADCLVCKPKACNNCTSCQRAAQKGWQLEKHCTAAKQMRQKQCPNVPEPPTRDDGRDPRRYDKGNELFRAPSESCELLDNPSKATALQRRALGALLDELKRRGDDVSKWPSMLQNAEQLQCSWKVDEIISLGGAKNTVELMLRLRYCQGGGYPSRAELGAMGDLEHAVMMQLNGFHDTWNQSTTAEGQVALASVHASQSDKTWKSFTSYILGGRKHGKRPDESWDDFWARWSRYFGPGGRKRAGTSLTAKGDLIFRRQLNDIKATSRQWATTPEAIAWLKERNCTYQCDQSLITASGYWVLSTQVLKSSCRGARRPRTRSATGRVAASASAASGGACWRRTAWSTTPTSS